MNTSVKYDVTSGFKVVGNWKVHSYIHCLSKVKQFLQCMIWGAPMCGGSGSKLSIPPLNPALQCRPQVTITQQAVVD